MSKPDWSRRLPRPLIIPGVMTLKTLADVRKLIGHLPKDHRAKSTWQHVEEYLNKAARGEVETIDVTVPLRMVLSMENVECRPK
jgi:hypothetical protein